ncbi:unnamed protein product [Urochloa decumbens]|uniref:DUF1618 domain-containing protein n=1 Tax=Urochloa decumbens TaxID=240449 RepID=A0ABC9G926_9POAL
MAAAAAIPLPKWVMLERFIFRRDDPASFRGDARTTAASTTSVGASFRISFVLADPPTPSRLYLSWPDGPKRDKMCHLVAAHRDLVLLRLDSFLDTSSPNPSPFGEIAHDYFLYIADPRSRAQLLTPVLRRLPACTVHNAHYGRPISPVAELVKKIEGGRDEDHFCHHCLSQDYISCHPSGRAELYRSVCVTESGRTLAFLDVVHHDGADMGRMTPAESGFAIVSMALTGTRAAEAVMAEADELWAAHSLEDLPREVMMIPLMSMDEPDAAHFVLYDWGHAVGKVSLVTIDMSTKRVVVSVVPYINGEDDLATDDADFVKAKPNFFMHFLPAEFPKFLNVNL